MNTLDTAKLIWRQRNKYATKQQLAFNDPDEALAAAVDAKLAHVESRLSSLERKSASREAV